MANDEIQFVDFMRGTKHPKLSWVMAQLVILNITHRIQGKGVAGPVLQVDESQLVKAHKILLTSVGVMVAGGSLTDENILVMDLRDDHPFFESDMDIEELGLPGLGSFPPLGIPREDPVFEPPTILPDVDDLIEGQDSAQTEEVGEDEPDPFAVDTPAVPVLADAKAPVLKSAIESDPEVDELPEGVEEPDEETDPFAEETTEEATEEDDSLWDTEEEVDEHPELDYQRANKVLTVVNKVFSGVSDPVEMYEVSSANLSAIGFRINQKDPTKGTFYGLFKGGDAPYRYGPVLLDHFNEVLSNAVRKAEGRQEASVGSAYHHLIKVDAEDGKIKCQRLADGKWVEVPPKSERTKALKKKHDGK